MRQATISIVAVMLLILASPLASIVTGQQELRSNKKVGRELIRLEEEWHNAYVRHDPAPLERILADEYVAISGNGGRHNKALAIEGLKTDTATYEYSTPYDLDMRFYGNTVVVVGRTKEKGRNQNGTEFTAEYRWTDVFVKRQSRWQCVAAQVARIPPPKQKQ